MCQCESCDPHRYHEIITVANDAIEEGNFDLAIKLLEFVRPNPIKFNWLGRIGARVKTAGILRSQSMIYGTLVENKLFVSQSNIYLSVKVVLDDSEHWTDSKTHILPDGKIIKGCYFIGEASMLEDA